MSVRGVDVSHWNGRPDWSALAAAGCAFAWIKATEGTSWVDPELARNWAGTKAAGIIRGAYHFARPGTHPATQVDHFLATVRPEPGDLIALDHETDDGRSPAQCAAWARAWCSRVEDVSGITPIVYTFPNFADTGHCDGLGGWPLWIASYRSAPDVPAPWRTWTFWQTSSNGRLGPHRGDVDTFNGSLEELHDLAQGDDMRLSDEDLDRIAVRVWDRPMTDPATGEKDVPAHRILRRTRADVARGKLDPAAIAAAVVAALPEGGVDQATVEAGVVDVMKRMAAAADDA